MKLNESQEAKIKNYIKKIVRESIESMGGYSQFEGDYKKDYPHKGENEKPLHNPNGTSDQNNENEKEEMLRSSIRPLTNCLTITREWRKWSLDGRSASWNTAVTS